MKLLQFLIAALSASVVFAAVPVTENTNHAAMLSSDLADLAANKRIVYDMWRTVVEAFDVQSAQTFVDQNFVSHSPVIANGLAGFVAYYSSKGTKKTVQERVQSKLVAIVAEHDLVGLVRVDDRGSYTTTAFDLYRLKNSKIIEYWSHTTATTTVAYTPPVEPADHNIAIASLTCDLATKKLLVYDMWRTILDAQQVEEAPKFLAVDYIQHNPLAETGLSGFMNFFRTIARPQPVKPKIVNFVTILGEGDLVILATLKSYNDSKGKAYMTTWFDMFRVKDSKMAEHWDTATK